MNIFYKDFIAHIDKIKSRCRDKIVISELEKEEDLRYLSFDGIRITTKGEICAVWKGDDVCTVAVILPEKEYYMSDTEFKEHLNQLKQKHEND